jgi:hypothetical protein
VFDLAGRLIAIVQAGNVFGGAAQLLPAATVRQRLNERYLVTTYVGKPGTRCVERHSIAVGRAAPTYFELGDLRVGSSVSLCLPPDFQPEFGAWLLRYGLFDAIETPSPENVFRPTRSACQLPSGDGRVFQTQVRRNYDLYLIYDTYKIAFAHNGPNGIVGALDWAFDWAHGPGRSFYVETRLFDKYPAWLLMDPFGTRR